MLLKSVFLLSLIGFSSQMVQALPYQSYQRLSSENEILIQSQTGTIVKDTINTANKQNTGIGSKPDTLINQNLDKSWQAPKPATELKTSRPFPVQHYAEGTGTRGGGSGLIVKKNEMFDEVILLEVFRSENLERYNLFFPIDPELRKLESEEQSEESARFIFETVLSRIQQVTPNLARRIKYLYENELPFKNWVPIYIDLPQIKDETQHPYETNTDRVQIAYRRTQHILYNSRAYAAMNDLNRAALWLHEYIYALSGLENSIKTQRAVSLFLSSDFLKIAQDKTKIGQLLFDLDLLSLSQSSLSINLPPKTRVAEKKQTENCGPIQNMKLDNSKSQFEIIALINGVKKNISISKADAAVIIFAYLMSKSQLQADFPIYKYYGQKILMDQLCLDPTLTKITQVQSALAIDEEMAEATRQSAVAEVEYFKAQSHIAIQMNLGKEQLNDLLRASEKQLEFMKTKLRSDLTAITPLEKILNPKILGESIIEIEL
jgi:hypothetical protein